VQGDEASLKELVQKDKVHSDAFQGSFWIAVSAVALYDFSDQKDKTDLNKLPIENEQGFARIHLDKNMRNGNQIVEASFELHNGTIEKGIIQGFTMKTSFLNDDQDMEITGPKCESVKEDSVKNDTYTKLNTPHTMDKNPIEPEPEKKKE
jgi:hypothetical protein